ncbi:hypothetical protein ACWDUC_14065 [Streptomyces tricolor]|uniref:hypothetical protein n=1 Tax=Streptomyces sp. FBKL.4005 TaxID=2015515 RepID=UPI000B95DA21|nr:hypothetical protein [Streptomyces sp. FBKL.4005]OYP14076.1 hypothetical protein CFC35_05785 [Streptomyces sp. FBKL.4005]
MSIDITMRGPLFDGRATRAADRACDDARDDVAAYAEERVLMGTAASFKTRTPYYETRVTTERVSGDVSLVHDQGVIYGPWLEGVGSRNAPVTRFAGYHFWRAAKQAVAARGPQIAEAAVRRHLPEMGG